MNPPSMRNNYPLSSLSVLNKQCLRFICSYIKQNTQDAQLQQRSKSKLKQMISCVSKQIPTLYEIIKILHFIFKHQVPYPAALKALIIANCLFQTCEIPIVNMLETYILPYAYLSAINFAQNYFTKKIQNFPTAYEKLVFQYQSKCFDAVIAWAYVKPKLLFETQQMITNSSYYDCMIRIASVVLKKSQNQAFSIPMEQLIVHLLNNYQQFVKKYKVVKQKFNQNVKVNYNHLKSDLTKQYSNFIIKMFRKQIVKQLKSQSILQINLTQVYANILDAHRFPIQNLPQLNISSILQSLDPILTFPLNQLIFHILQKQQHDFAVMKQCIRIMTKLIKWGDLETFFNVVYSEEIQKMATKLFQVRGFISFEEGQNYLPQIAYQSNRVPFYIQFLRFLQIFAHCKIPQFDEEMQQIKLRKIYKQLKIRKFLFPQNLMIQKIKKQFTKNISLNCERNQILLKRIDQIKVKQSFEMRFSMSLELLASYKSPNRQRKNMIIMNSINVLQALRKQFKQLIGNLKDQYQTIKQSIRQVKNFKNNYQKIIQLHNNRRKITNLKQQIKILSQQLDNNEKQTDWTVKKYLAAITKKGKKYLKQIIPQILTIQKQNDRIIKQLSQFYQTINEIKKVQDLKSVNKIVKFNKIQTLKQSLSQDQSYIDELSELLLESLPQIKNSDQKQNSKIFIQNVDNIISITSQYAWPESNQHQIRQLQLNCIPEFSSIQCNRFSINSNCMSPQLISQKNKHESKVSFIPSLFMQTNQKKNKAENNQIIEINNKINKQEKDKPKKNIQNLIEKVNIRFDKQVNLETNKKFKLVACNMKSDYLKMPTSPQVSHSISQKVVNKENINPNTKKEKQIKEPKTPSTFKQCLQMKNQMINSTQFASDYLSARQNSKQISRLKSKSKCLSNLPLNCIYSNSPIGINKSKSYKVLLKALVQKQNNEEIQVKNEDKNIILCAQEKNIQIENKNFRKISELYYNNEYNLIPYKKVKNAVPKSLGIRDQNLRARTLQNYRKKHKISQVN